MNDKARFLWIGLVLLLVVSSLPSFAQENRWWDPLDGIPVRQGFHIEWFRSVTTNDQGQMAMIWSDTREGGRDLYMQVVNPDGSQVWDQFPDGKRVAWGPNRQEDPHVMATSDGNWIITWIDYRDSGPNEDVGNVYISKIDANGDPMWDDHPDWDLGIPLAVVQNKQLVVQSFDDGNGGAVTIWVDGRNQFAELYGQHINADGDIQWFPTWDPDEPNGIVLAGGDATLSEVGSASYTADTDGNGGMIFGWQDHRIATDKNLYCNRIDADGQLVWADSTGLELSTANGEQARIRMAPDGEGGAFFTWEDRQQSDNYDLLGQHIDADGNVSWTAGGTAICDAIGSQEAPRIVNSAVGEAIVIWEDRRIDNFTFDLYVQRISDNNGSPEFHWGSGTDGYLLTDASSNQREARLFGDGQGGAVFTWKDERNGDDPNSDLFVQRIDVNGDWQWGPDYNGMELCDADNLQTGNIVRLMNSTTIGFVWFDYRLGSPGLFYQIYDMAGNEQLQHNGIEQVYGIDGNGSGPTIIDSGVEGVYYISWRDGRLGQLGEYPFVQRLNAPVMTDEHSFGYAVNGFSMLPGFPDGAQTIEILELQQTAASDGGLISVWKDDREEFLPLVYAQKMDLDGNVLWGDQGVAIAYNPSIDPHDPQQRPLVLPADDGGAFTFFQQVDENYWLQVNAQRLNADGERQWFDGENYSIALTSITEDHAIQAVEYFENGTILIVFQHNDPSNDKDLYAICMNQDGTLAWSEIPICEADELQKSAKTVVVDGGIVVVWEDLRRGESINDLYGQFITPNGDLLWATDGVIMAEDDAQQNEARLQSSGYDADWFWLTWKSSADGVTEDVFTQRFDLDGDPLLIPAEGVQLGVDTNPQQEPEAVMDGSGGLYVMWEENIDGQIFSDLVYTHIDINGDVNLEPDGEFLCAGYHRQAEVSAVPDGLDGFIAVWRDNRSTGKQELENIYTQRVNMFVGVEEKPEAAQPMKIELGNAYPNPFNPSTNISFSIDRPASVKLVVYDVLGREVVRLVDRALNAGQYEVNWNGMSEYGVQVSSGMYFYRLEVNDRLLTRRMVLMK